MVQSLVTVNSSIAFCELCTFFGSDYTSWKDFHPTLDIESTNTGNVYFIISSFIFCSPACTTLWFFTWYTGFEFIANFFHSELLIRFQVHLCNSSAATDTGKM
jgi:hypothetical protein